MLFLLWTYDQWEHLGRALTENCKFTVAKQNGKWWCRPHKDGSNRFLSDTFLGFRFCSCFCRSELSSCVCADPGIDRKGEVWRTHGLCQTAVQRVRHQRDLQRNRADSHERCVISLMTPHKHYSHLFMILPLYWEGKCPDSYGLTFWFTCHREL